MVAALDRQDIGTVLRLVAGNIGCSQHRLAAAISVPQGRISEYIAGRRRPSLGTVAHIADGLAMPEHARQRLGLSGNSAPDHHDPAGMSTDNLLRMAEQLGHGNALLRTSPIPAQAGEADAWVRLDHVLRGHDHVDQAAVAHLDALTRGLWQLSDQLPARAVMRAIAVHADRVAGLLSGTMPDALRRRLIVVAGQAAGIAACCAADLGHHAAMATQLRTAGTAAHESDDPMLSSLVYEFQSQAQARQGDHQQALDIVTTAKDHATAAV